MCPTCASRAPLCDLCRAQRIAWHTGLARVIGQRWGISVRERAPGRPWPSWEASARVRELAAGKVRELAAGDQELLESLARACAEAAGRAYGAAAPAPGSVAFTSGPGG